jgi:hypothetical protein
LRHKISTQPLLPRCFIRSRDIISKKGGKVPLFQLLAILNFPPEVNSKILEQRGPLEVKCNGMACSASNVGSKIKENLPGSFGTLGIIVSQEFSCQFDIGTNPAGKTLVIDKIKGLYADIPGPINPDVNKITVRMPNYVKLEI